MPLCGTYPAIPYNECITYLFIFRALYQIPGSMKHPANGGGQLSIPPIGVAKMI